MTPASGYDFKRDSAVSSSQSQMSFASSRSAGDASPITPDVPAVQEEETRDEVPEPSGQDDGRLSPLPPPDSSPLPSATESAQAGATQNSEGIAEDPVGGDASISGAAVEGRMDETQGYEEEAHLPAYSAPEQETNPSITQEKSTPAPSSATSLSLSPPATSSSTRLRAPSSATPPPKLTPAPKVKFEVEPVQWKGLTLDAALCE